MYPIPQKSSVLSPDSGHLGPTALEELSFLYGNKKNHRFLIENGGFLVAEAGLEPTTSGL